jgi:hypothetical protein
MLIFYTLTTMAPSLFASQYLCPCSSSSLFFTSLTFCYVYLCVVPSQIASEMVCTINRIWQKWHCGNSKSVSKRYCHFCLILLTWWKAIHHVTCHHVMKALKQPPGETQWPSTICWPCRRAILETDLAVSIKPSGDCCSGFHLGSNFWRNPKPRTSQLIRSWILDQQIWCDKCSLHCCFILTSFGIVITQQL